MERPAAPRPLAIPLEGGASLDALLDAPPAPRAAYLMAHGAGAGMTHPFLAAMASELAARGVATLRFQFPAMQRGSKRPDAPAVAQSAVRSAAAFAGTVLPGVPLVAGGKSFGGRMSSMAQAHAPLPGVAALAFLGFPLHPAGQPSDARAAHLGEVRVPMLFLQGSRDALADLALLRPVVDRLGPLATLAVFDDADHAFHVPAKSGRRDADVRAALADAFAEWLETVVLRGG